MPKISLDPLLNKIEHSNSFEKCKYIPDNSLDIIFCDPPTINNLNDKKLNNWNNKKDYKQTFQTFINICASKLKKTGIFYLIGEPSELICITNFLEENGFFCKASYFFKKNKKNSVGKRIKDSTKTIQTIDVIYVFIRDMHKKVKKLLKVKQDELQKSSKDINVLLNGNSNGGGYWSLYCGDNSNNILPNENHWNILKDYLQIDINYNDIIPQFIEWNGTDFWEDITSSNDKFLCGTNRPMSLYDRLIKMNKNDSNVLTCWDPFTGYGNCVNVMKKLGCTFYACEYDMKIYYKSVLQNADEA